MILCDSGPMVALVDRTDPYHSQSAAAVQRLPAEPLVTTWPCITEAMHLLGRSGGHLAQERLWAFLVRRTIVIYEMGPDEAERLRTLMREYSDLPMDLADASLISAAERLGARGVFTHDRHFYAYRTASGYLEMFN